MFKRAAATPKYLQQSREIPAPTPPPVVSEFVTVVYKVAALYHGNVELDYSHVFTSVYGKIQTRCIWWL